MMVRQKDQFWEYAEDLRGRFLCKFCQKNYSGGIARVKSHLSRLHGRDIAICNSVPDDVQALALVAVRGKDTPYKKRKAAQSLRNAEANGVELPIVPLNSSTYTSSRSHQSTVLALTAKEDNGSNKKVKESIKRDKESVDRMVAQAFMMNNIAVDVIQSPSFISMVEAIAEFGSGYVLPSCATLCTKLLHDARKEVDEYVSTIKGCWSLTGCTLMSDTWNCNVFAYSPKGAVFLSSYERVDNKNVGEFLRDVILPITDKIGSENVVQIVVNSGFNDDTAEDMVTKRYPHIYTTRCASRGIQLLLEDIYKEVEWIQTILDEAKAVVDYMCKDPVVLQLLMVHTADKELKRPCGSTFASYFMMLQSLIEVENGLQTMVVSPEWSVVNEHRILMANNIARTIQCIDFWRRVKEVVSALEPLMSVLRLVEGDGSTAGYLYEAMERVRIEFTQRCSSDESKYFKLLKLFNKRRNGDIVQKIHAAAAFLNPSLMYDGKIKYEESDIRDGMNYVVERMVSSNEMDDFAAQLLLYNGKSSKLFNTLSVLMMKKAHPRVWWEYNGGEVPLLRKLAIRILSQPCSSSSCGRNWGTVEAPQTENINKLECSSEDFVYTRMNMKMMASYRDLEMQDKFALDIDKRGEHLEDLHDYVIEKPQNDDGTSDRNGDMLIHNEASGVGSSSS